MEIWYAMHLWTMGVMRAYNVVYWRVFIKLIMFVNRKKTHKIRRLFIWVVINDKWNLHLSVKLGESAQKRPSYLNNLWLTAHAYPYLMQDIFFSPNCDHTIQYWLQFWENTKVACSIPIWWMWFHLTTEQKVL